MADAGGYDDRVQKQQRDTPAMEVGSVFAVPAVIQHHGPLRVLQGVLRYFITHEQIATMKLALGAEVTAPAVNGADVAEAIALAHDLACDPSAAPELLKALRALTKKHKARPLLAQTAGPLRRASDLKAFILRQLAGYVRASAAQRQKAATLLLERAYGKAFYLLGPARVRHPTEESASKLITTLDKFERLGLQPDDEWVVETLRAVGATSHRANQIVKGAKYAKRSRDFAKRSKRPKKTANPDDR